MPMIKKLYRRGRLRMGEITIDYRARSGGGLELTIDAPREVAIVEEQYRGGAPDDAAPPRPPRRHNHHM